MEGSTRLRWDSTSVHVLCSGTFLIASAGLMEIDLFVVYSMQLWMLLHGSCIRLKQICTETKILSFSPVSSLWNLIVETLSSCNPPQGDFHLQLPCSLSPPVPHCLCISQCRGRLLVCKSVAGPCMGSNNWVKQLVPWVFQKAVWFPQTPLTAVIMRHHYFHLLAITWRKGSAFNVALGHKA